MSITFACENCGKYFTLDDKFAGKKGKCKQCGAVMAIPGGVVARAESSPSHMAVSPSRRPPAPTRPPRDDIYGLDEVPTPVGKGLPDGIEEVAAGSPVSRQFKPRSGSLYDPPKRKASSGGGFPMAARIAIGVVFGFFGLGVVGGVFNAMRTAGVITTPGLTSRADLEKILQERVNLHLQLVNVLQGVTDVDSARSASPQANQKFRGMTANLRKLKVLKALQTDLDAIKAKYGAPQMQAAQQVVQEIQRIAVIPGAYDALDVAAAVDELDREEKTVPGMVQVEAPPAPVAAPVEPQPAVDPAPEPPPPDANPAPQPKMKRPLSNRPKAGNRKGTNRPNIPNLN
jgi:hypothetical protein